MMRKNVPALFLAALFLAALVLSSCVSFSSRSSGETLNPAPKATFQVSEDPPPRSRTADVVERVLPSLVNVKVSGFSQSALGSGQTEGEGSGSIIDENGVIITNYHVVQGAVRVRIFFQDGHDPVDGRVIGTDPGRDLAVIRVPTTGLTPIEIGRSSALRLGDEVIALGFPLGLGGPTVTKGIVSGTNRNLEVPRPDNEGGQETVTFEGLLQTDAAINPGNSGGPLIDSAGRLVAINTAAAGAGSAENVGFAIAIDSALPVIEEILSEPAEERAWLGVLVANVDPTAAAQLGLPPNTTGALLTDIVKGAPADDAGIKPGFVVTSIDGNAIDSAEDLTRVLTGFDPGDVVAVDVVTKDGSETFEVTLGQRPLPPEE